MSGDIERVGLGSQMKLRCWLSAQNGRGGGVFGNRSNVRDSAEFANIEGT